jgi:hypothetical protein
MSNLIIAAMGEHKPKKASHIVIKLDDIDFIKRCLP